jgi:hypothetical protein
VIKGIVMYMQHEEVLNINMSGSLYCCILGPNCRMSLLYDCDHQLKVVVRSLHSRIPLLLWL